MTQGSIPSLYEWAGGAPALVRLTEIFYRRVEGEPLLAGLFAKAEPGHAGSGSVCWPGRLRTSSKAPLRIPRGWFGLPGEELYDGSVRSQTTTPLRAAR